MREREWNGMEERDGKNDLVLSFRNVPFRSANDCKKFDDDVKHADGEEE